MIGPCTIISTEIIHYIKLQKQKKSSYYSVGPCHISGSYWSASHCGGPVSSPGQVIWNLWWTKWHWAGFLQVLRFPLSILIPPIAPQSSSFVIWGWYNRPNSGRSTKWTQSHPMRNNNSIQFVLYYLCAESTATRPIADTAQCRYR
jgi:hypothetical protein